MEYRRFGRTGLEISSFVLGAGAVGGLIITGDDDTRRRALRLCLDHGVNWIDTAADYGQGRSEEALGWLLAELPDERRPYVSTKVRLDPAGDIEAQFERSIEASLKRLRMSSVDLLQLHNPIVPTPAERAVTLEQVTGARGALACLERARQDGLTRHIGITALGDLDCLKEVIGSGRIDTAQIYYNLLNPSAGRTMGPGWPVQDFKGLLDACAAGDVGTMNIRVLAAGVLATTERHGREGMITRDTALEDEERRAALVHEALGDAYGTPSQTAIRFALAEPRLHGIIVGIEKLAYLEEALAGIEMGPLPREALAKLEPVYAANLQRSA